MKTIPIRHITTARVGQSQPGRFSIRDLQEVLKNNDLVHDLHKHDFYFILALRKGTGIHDIDFIQYPVHDHSIFILRPGQVHRLELKAGSSGFIIEFDPAYYPSNNTGAHHRWKKAAAKNYCKPEQGRFMKLHAILENIYHEFTARQENYTEAIKANLDLFVIEYIRQSNNPAVIAKTASNYVQERFEELLQLLEINIKDMKNVSQYAQLLNLSSYQLNAITRSSVGKTVSELINEQIILETKRHLLATSGQVKDIADTLGYEDASYFTRFFKKHTGYAPEEFRKNFK